MSEMALRGTADAASRNANMMLDPQERADVIAYILSLKGD
jgi:hypothetical protein